MFKVSKLVELKLLVKNDNQVFQTFRKYIFNEKEKGIFWR